MSRNAFASTVEGRWVKQVSKRGGVETRRDATWYTAKISMGRSAYLSIPSEDDPRAARKGHHGEEEGGQQARSKSRWSITSCVAASQRKAERVSNREVRSPAGACSGPIGCFLGGYESLCSSTSERKYSLGPRSMLEERSVVRALIVIARTICDVYIQVRTV